MPRLPLALLISVLSLFCSVAVPADGAGESSAADLKALAFDLAHAGEFDAAEAVFAGLSERRDDPLARSAWFHFGNLLETSHVLDAQSAAELQATLLRAREAYGRAVRDMEGAPPAARRQAEMNLRRVEDKLALLAGLDRGGKTPLEIAETLDDLDAPAAAAHSLEGRLRPDDPTAAEFYFLWMLYRVAYVDHLYLRLGNAWKLAGGSRAGSLPPGSVDRSLDRWEAAVRECESVGASAVERFGASPRLLDLRIFTADAHRYHAQIEVFRAAREAGSTDPHLSSGGPVAAPSAPVPDAAIRHLETAARELRTALDRVEAARRDPSLLSPAQQAAWPAETLHLYAVRLAESLAADEALLDRLAGPSGDASTSG